MTRVGFLSGAAAIVVQLMPSEGEISQSLQNEIDHALTRAPSNCVQTVILPFETNGLTRAELALRLVSEQKADGRWWVGTNEVTSTAVKLLTALQD